MLPKKHIFIYIVLSCLCFLASCSHHPLFKDNSVISDIKGTFYEDGGSFALFANLDGKPVYLLCHRAMKIEDDRYRDGRITISSKAEDIDYLYINGRRLNVEEENKLKLLLTDYLQLHNNLSSHSRDGIQMMIEIIDLPPDVRSSGIRLMLKCGYSF